MATAVIMPKLEMAQEMATVLEWLRGEGEPVQKGEPLLVVETDKVTVEIESPASGVLAGISAVPDQQVPVTEVIAYILAPGEELPESASAGPEASPGTEPSSGEKTGSPKAGESGPSAPSPQKLERPAMQISPVARRLAEASGVDPGTIIGTGPGGQVTRADVEAALEPSTRAADSPPHKVRASPAARRLARERRVDLSEIPGSGPRGRVQGEDVLSFKARPEGETEPSSKLISMKGVRLLTAERLVASARETAPVTLVTEIDATDFVQVRDKLKERVAEQWGFAPGYSDLLGIIVARALREFPYMNARLSEDGAAIEQRAEINVGLAVDTDRGLLVPVIRDADRKGLRAFGEAFRTLVARARAGDARPEDLSDGTFTITNLGMYEIDAFTPIINLPEAAILGVGRIQPKPVAREDQVVVRQMWTLSLTFDHRLVDGAPAARFLQRIKHLVEFPFLLFE